MEPLENRIARLLPEQRKEVEDFVDFLLLNNTMQQAPGTSAQPSPALMNAPPVLSPEPAPAAQAPPLRMQDLVVREDSRPPALVPEPAPASIHEIGTGHDDGITRDYMDYGKFEQPPSPATEAVAKVKKKIIARQADEKASQLLDWVD